VRRFTRRIRENYRENLVMKKKKSANNTSVKPHYVATAPSTTKMCDCHPLSDLLREINLCLSECRISSLTNLAVFQFAGPFTTPSSYK
jgi:hypothetical protein